MEYKKIKISGKEFFVAVENGEIIYLDTEGIPDKNEVIKNKNCFKEIEKQLKEYFQGVRSSFNLKFKLTGTAFQKQVWNELMKIPYGTTVAYYEIAQRLGDVKKVRAVASAIGKNPILFLVPCHRVIGKDKSLRGFRAGLTLKKELLLLENNL